VQSSFPNSAGSILKLCYELACDDGTALEEAAAQVPETPTCQEGETLKDYYVIESNGVPVATIKPYVSDVVGDVLYGYNGLTTAPALGTLVNLDNATSLMVHHDTKNDLVNLIINNGKALTVDGLLYDQATYTEMTLTNAPTNSHILVKDDPADGDVLEKTSPTDYRFQWSSIAPYTDGVVVYMGSKEFCADLTVVENTYPTQWKFLSGDLVNDLLTLRDRSEPGASFNICYRPTCEANTVDPLASVSASATPDILQTVQEVVETAVETATSAVQSLLSSQNFVQLDTGKLIETCTTDSDCILYGHVCRAGICRVPCDDTTLLLPTATPSVSASTTPIPTAAVNTPTATLVGEAVTAKPTPVVQVEATTPTPVVQVEAATPAPATPTPSPVVQVEVGVGTSPTPTPAPATPTPSPIPTPVPTATPTPLAEVGVGAGI